MSGVTVKIDKFNGNNSFSLWQIKMKALLKQQGCWGPLTGKKKAVVSPSESGSEKKVEAVLTPEEEALEEKAHSTILLSLVDEIIVEVASAETAADLWAKLESLYMTKSLTNKLLLKQRLFSLRMQEGTQLKDHLDRMNSVLLDLRNIDVKIEDEDAALILLVSLPSSFENFVQSFLGSRESVSLEEVRSALHNRELRLSASGSGTDNQASGLFVSVGKNSGKGKKKKPFKGGPKPNDVCNYCKEKGHWKSNCPKKKQSGSAAVAENEAKSDEDIALVAHGQLHPRDVWVLDSGASYHMCPRREWFSEYEEVADGKIKMADDSVCKIAGIGSVKLRTYDGRICTLTDVRHVPSMAKNLISVSLLDSRGFKYSGGDGVLNIFRGKDIVLRGFIRGTLYLLDGSTVTGSANVASPEIREEDMTKLWHMRLGHIGERGLQVLSKQDLLCGHKTKSLEFCEHCVYGKLHRKSFPKAIHRTKGTLDYIHFDYWGPARLEYLGGHRYFISMIDDYSRKT